VAQSKERVLPLALLFVAVSGAASAQQFACTAIRRGDTAASLAVRLTNDAHNLYEPWFQIVDPATSRWVSKAAYGRILPGWQVCLATTVAQGPQKARTADLAASWILVLVVLTPFFAFPVAKRYLNERRRMLDCMTDFAVAFVREFARPLPRRHPADRPIQASLRCAPYRGRLDILLAPTHGHSYPNLSDHRKNLSYDIERVLGLVPAQSFACREPYQRGNWVAIPFQRVVLPQEGAK
jgi:hypothetical protein